jgi:hypothetical protein
MTESDFVCYNDKNYVWCYRVFDANTTSEDWNGRIFRIGGWEDVDITKHKENIVKLFNLSPGTKP